MPPTCKASKVRAPLTVEIHVARPSLNVHFPSNAITTSKYTLLTFLPLNLMEQFRRVSNFYFLLVMICTLIPGASSINPLSAVVPFTFVLGVAAVKDGYEDWKRHQADAAANAVCVMVLRGLEFQPVPSRDIRVGDIVKYRHGQEIRADSLVLNSSLPDGLAYIETANLDGETNAKTRRAKAVTIAALGTPEGIREWCGSDCTAVGDAVRTEESRGVPDSTGSPLHQSNLLERPSGALLFATAHPRSGSDTTGQFSALESESEVQQSSRQHSRITTAERGPSNTSVHHREGSGAASPRVGVTIMTNRPNPNLALWHGKLHMPDDAVHPIGIDQFLPRGCMLRNTEWVICATLYTGNETKMMLNLSDRPAKFSVMETKVNYINVFLFCVNQFVIFLFCGLGVKFRFDNVNDDTAVDGHGGIWYVQYYLVQYTPVAMYFWRYLSIFALVSYLIPLSLYVSLEFVKATQIAYIAHDDKMAITTPDGEVRYPRPKTSNLNVQLAHVRYIFSDKTGTLTENMMNYVGGFVNRKRFDARANPGGLGIELVNLLHPDVANTVRHASPSSVGAASHGPNAFPESTAPFAQSGYFDATINSIGGGHERTHSVITASEMVDDHGTKLMPMQLCMRLCESEAVTLEEYRYLLTLALCHNVVCFDPLEEQAGAAHGGSQASLKSTLRRRSGHRSFRTLSAASLSGIATLPRIHGRTVSGVAAPGGGMPPRSLSHLSLHGAHDRTVSAISGPALSRMQSSANVMALLSWHRRTLSRHGHGNVAVCHSKRLMKTYEGQSLDEVALVKEARESGFELIQRSLKKIVVDVFGNPVVYDIVAELEFTPQRKLMSIILKRNQAADAEFYAKCRGRHFLHHHNLHIQMPSMGSAAVPGGSAVPGVGTPTNTPQRRQKPRVAIDVGSVPASQNPHFVASPLGNSIRRTSAHEGLVEFPKLRVSPKSGHDGMAATRHSRLATPPTPPSAEMLPPQDRNVPQRAPYCGSPLPGGSLAPPPLAATGGGGGGASSSAVPPFGTGEYLMLTKGADSAMFAALDANCAYNRERRAELEDALIEMASTGLRTLVLGYRNLDAAEVERWLPTFDAALADEERDEKLHEAYAMIEKELVLIGSTAVEDKLQDGVPETLAFLLSSEIVVWMLTGDKRETAVTIAATSGLMNPTVDIACHIDVSRMPQDSEDAVERAAEVVVKQLEAAKAECEANAKRVVLIIDGLSLQTILRDPERTKTFFAVGSTCRSAVCCRMTPLQKAEIVKLFQENTQGVALAIGDGANDVSMIQESRIGIGIMGLEGAQAELASDFAIPKFRHLRRLLAVHGRHALYRESQCILYSIYKNVVLTAILMSYCYHNAFTGVPIMDSWALAMFNVFYVSIPPLLLGIVDKDIEDEMAETHPQLYPPLSKENMYLNGRSLLRWWIDGCAHGFFIYFLIMYAVEHDALHPYLSESMEYCGFFMYAVLLILVNIMAVLTIQLSNVFTVGFMALTFILVVVFNIAHSEITNLAGSTEMFGVPIDAFRNCYFWIFLVFFNVGFLLVWNITREYLLRTWWPENNTLVAKIAAKRAWRYAVRRWEREATAGANVTAGVPGASGTQLHTSQEVPMSNRNSPHHEITASPERLAPS